MAMNEGAPRIILIRKCPAPLQITLLSGALGAGAPCHPTLTAIGPSAGGFALGVVPESLDAGVLSCCDFLTLV